ncbi:MAG: DUF3027 domain-containing protein [Sporichthyaceae bacterium]
MTTTKTRRQGLDPVCAEAIDLARDAAVDGAPGEVGEHLGVEHEDERVVTHRFACLHPGYRSWHWAVTLVRASRAKTATVAEVVLLPGSDAVLAPPWVPWSDRLQPGDIGPGDILPTAPDDDRLLPGFTDAAGAGFAPDSAAVDSGELDLVVAELGLGRHRVLSPLGRADITDRWYSGERGPQAPSAQAAPGQCSTCGFQVMLAGSMGRVFGVCANEYSPDDGRVVSHDHGCGGHSEVVAIPAGLAERPELLLNELEYDEVDVRSSAPDATAVVEAPAVVDDSE